MTADPGTDPAAVLRARLATIGDRLAQLRSANRERLLAASFPEELAAALVELTGPDAPPAWRRIRGRVRAGELTWQRLWADPRGEAGSEGRALVHEAGVLAARRR